MAKKKMNAKAMAGIQAYRAKIKSGEIQPPKRKTTAERLALKKAKLEELTKKVEELKKEIAVLDSQANKAEKKNLMSKFTVDELKAYLAAKAATK